MLLSQSISRGKELGWGENMKDSRARLDRNSTEPRIPHGWAKVIYTVETVLHKIL